MEATKKVAAQNQIPKAFDWVNARFDCSLPCTFRLLADVVDSDVKAIQARVADATFTINRPTDSDKFIVSKTWNTAGFPSGESIAFELLRRGISVKDVRTGKQLFFAVPELTEAGDCKLHIEGEPNLLELWQVSRKALEALFFGSS
jgi:hypothetical protein